MLSLPKLLTAGKSWISDKDFTKLVLHTMLLQERLETTFAVLENKSLPAEIKLQAIKNTIEKVHEEIEQFNQRREEI